MIKMRISGIIINRIVEYMSGKGCVIMNDTIVRKVMVSATGQMMTNRVSTGYPNYI